jgi:hypothetical protein
MNHEDGNKEEKKQLNQTGRETSTNADATYHAFSTLRTHFVIENDASVGTAQVYLKVDHVA